MLRTRGKRKIKRVIKTWNVCICVCVKLWRSSVSKGYGANCAEGEGSESAHPGNVTELAAVRRGKSFLAVNKSRMEMRCSMKA